MRHRLLTLALACLGMAAAAWPAQAHPHVFIDVTAALDFQAGKVAAARFEWRFDEVYSSMLLQAHRSREAAFTPAESQRLRAENFDLLKKFNYLTYIKVGGKVLTLDSVGDFQARIDSGQHVVFAYTVPLPQPVDPKKTKLTIATYDDTFYMDLAPADQDPLTMAGPGAEKCAYKVVEDKEHPIYYGMVNPYRLDVTCKE